MKLSAKWRTAKVHGICVFIGTIANALVMAEGYRRLMHQGSIAFLVPVLWGVFCWYPLLLIPSQNMRKAMWITWFSQFLMCVLVYYVGTKVSSPEYFFR